MVSQNDQAHVETKVDEAPPNKWAIVGFIAVLIIALGAIIWTNNYNQAKLQQATKEARVVSDKAIDGLQQRDGASVRKLGSKKFQSTYTDKELTTQFKSIEVATSEAPHIQERFTRDSSSGQVIYFVYKYNTLKVPYYVRTAMINESGQWRLTHITGNVDENKLLTQ